MNHTEPKLKLKISSSHYTFTSAVWDLKFIFMFLLNVDCMNQEVFLVKNQSPWQGHAKPGSC